MTNRILLAIWGLFLSNFSVVFADTISSPSRPAETGLYRVMVGSQAEADILTELQTEAILKIPGGYLILADASDAARIEAAGITCTFVADDIDRRHMALDISHDQSGARRYPIIYEEGEMRIFRIDPAQVRKSGENPELASLIGKSLPIIYDPPAGAMEIMLPGKSDLNLDSLIALISQDSLESYSYWLQDMRGRPSGSNQGVASLLAARFEEFGYDSVYLDDFWAMDWWGEGLLHGWNVVVNKPGTIYHADQIVIGAHLDAVPVSPGADDNGSGVAAVMEMARVLKDFETNMNIVFVLFDNEEAGLLGSYDYARKAYERYDRIRLMINLDMIAFYRNSTEAKLYHGSDTAFVSLWIRLADSLPSIDINGYLYVASGNSDNAPFLEYGYPAIFVHEYAFSSVYHSARDSTTYMNFDYFTRMTKASLATAAYVDEFYPPAPTLLMSCLGGPPTFFVPGTADSFKIKIEEYAGGILDPGNAQLIGMVNGGPPQAIPLTYLNDGIYTAPFPPVECGDRLDYYVMALESVTGRLCFYPKGDTSVRALKASVVRTILDDNFETDKGWTVAGTASDGLWERGKASGNFSVPKFDYDGSGRCYMTDPSPLCDVDNGTTALISPAYAIAPGDAYIEYARWFSNDLGASANEDIFKVYLYHGSQTSLVEVVGPVEQAHGDWYHRSFWVSDIIDPQLPIKLRFDACDLNYDSYVEAAVDAVKIIHYSYAPDILTGSISDAILGDAINVQFDGTCCHDPIIWSDRDGSLESTGLTLSADGLLSGVPSDTGVISFTVLATDTEGMANEKAYSFHVWKTFVCGDAGMDYELNVGDAVYLINFVFKGGPAPYPMCVGDANGDNETNVGDAVYLINFIFKNGPAPMEGCCADLK